MSDDNPVLSPKTKAEALPKTMDAFLKYEATSASRVLVPAPSGTKLGQLVPFAWANNAYFVALCDEQAGKVLIQPVNCVMDTRHISDEDLAKAGGYEALIKAWLPYGVAVASGDKRMPQVPAATAAG